MALQWHIARYRDIDWPPFPPDLSTADFFPVGLPEGQGVWDMASIPDLKQHIWEHTETAPNDLLQLLMTSLPSAMPECRVGDGGRPKNAIFMCWLLV
jgi:hypothetical protein